MSAPWRANKELNDKIYRIKMRGLVMRLRAEQRELEEREFRSWLMWERYMMDVRLAELRAFREADHPRYKNGKFASKASGANTDWTGAEPQNHSREEMDAVVEYAAAKGVRIYDPYKFDGDIELLKEQIDVISYIAEEYKINAPITIKFSAMLKDDEFAETYNNTIAFNKKALRNREISNRNLQKDMFLSANDVKGIAAHEMGHIISRKYGEKGLDIAAETYYNIHKKKPSKDDLLNHLKKNVSVYSGEYKRPPTGEDVPVHKRKYIEITPEAIAKDMYGEKTEFSAEYIKNLKGRCGL